MQEPPRKPYTRPVIENAAAAVAAGECFLALGSDTGGSIRQPAGFCGIVGMKPTYGTVSRNGLIAYGSSLDQIGPLCRDVADCAALLEAISGKDRMDSTSMERRTDFTAALTEGVKGLRIGIPKDYFSEGLDEEVKKAVLQAAQKLAQLGAQVEEFDLSLTEYAVPAYYTIASAEASSNLERFDGVKYGYRTPEYEGLHDMYKRTRSEGFGTEVKRRIMLGSFVLSSGYYDAYYLKALRVKAMIRKAFDEAFSRFDCILGPVAPAPAPLLGESLKDPIRMYLGDIYTISANLAGIPGISLPCGLTSDGLPIGVQLMADCFQEKKLLRDACKELLPPQLLYRKKSPYPKTYSPVYEALLVERFQKILANAKAPVHRFLDRKKAERFLMQPKDYGKPWFGQLMAGPQMIAYFLQINYWMERYSIE